MTDTSLHLMECPTRADGAVALIVHSITSCQCAERQARRYHKCATCVFVDGASASGPPPVTKLLELEPVPKRPEPVAPEPETLPAARAV